jgi:carbon starvation protein
MSLALIAIFFSICLCVGYRFYGNFIASLFQINDAQPTPAHTQHDKKDFVPTRSFYLFAQHFSAIAAAGPIAGPIMACSVWGWLPCLLWIAFGVVFIGAVHDFASLTVSVRHGAVSIAQITRTHIGERAGTAMMAFIWLALVYVIVAFTDITAGSFVGISEELVGTHISFNPGGAVAMAAILYLIVSIIMGIFEKLCKPNLALSTIIFVPLAFLSVYVGTKFSHILIFDAKIWSVLIITYCVLSSLMPVWLLLQPRGYLGGFFLYTVIAIGIIGIFAGNFEIKHMAFKTWDTGESAGAIFPFLFVTIACGACSGFHGLICSGTTSKQVDRESHMRSIGYGAMLCEAFVALIALATVMIFSPAEIAGLKPGTIYGKGIGVFLTRLVGEEYISLATTFGAMAFSTFVFDTLDVSTRLGRYLLQELFNARSRLSAWCATLITALAPLSLILIAQEGSYLQFWTLFGAANQLLAALSLLAITMWLYQRRMRIAFTLLPMLFILSITLWALIKISWDNWQKAYLQNLGLPLINSFTALVLILLAVYLVLSALYKLRLEQNKLVRLTEPN